MEKKHLESKLKKRKFYLVFYLKNNRKEKEKKLGIKKIKKNLSI